ncbi:GMC family oxidoreductase [Ensifer sp. IC3342]|nr:GMC family oxidoreductase [Ensifer sp. BRP08]MCA1450157.1 GMC family oxidoreductase [Ensifer sp. IC3342]
MFADAHAFSGPFQVCIVGAGPVGLAVALELSRLNIRTLLLDAGARRARRPRPNEAPFDVCENQNHRGDRETLGTGLGGTSRRWGGKCVEFDDIDFAKRNHIGDGNWPISHGELSPFYERARAILSCDADIDEPAAIEPPGFFRSLERWTRVRDTAAANGKELHCSPQLTVVLNTRVHSIEFDPVAGTVRKLGVSCRGHSHFISAQYFVLACGGRGNARLLLNLQAEFPDLFSGKKGPLGRFYMGHLAGEIAQVQFSSSEQARRYWFYKSANGTFVRRRFQPDAQLQSEFGVSNIAMWPQNRDMATAVPGDTTSSLGYVLKNMNSENRGPTEPSIAPHLWNLARNPLKSIRSAANLFHKRVLLHEPHLFVPDRHHFYRLRYHAEQIPNRESRVSLSEARDCDGSLKLDVSFKYLTQDYQSTVLAHQALDLWLARQGIGRLVFLGETEELERLVAMQAKDGYHQIGVTRMSANRRDGVVNAHCRVHDIANLFVAGSSVFVTSGQANPTLPAVAMAVRLAHHIHSLGSMVPATILRARPTTRILPPPSEIAQRLHD